MKRFWFSDTHFFHFNVIKYSNRPFLHEVQGNKIVFNREVIKEFEFKGNQVFESGKLVKELDDDSKESKAKYLESSMKYNSVKLMNETMAQNWNKIVGPEDLVYFVGDFSFGGTQVMTELLSKLNGKKILIKGNHDKKSEIMIAAGFAEVHNELEVEIDGERVLMSHYPFVDLDLYQAAQDRPNVMKIHKKGYQMKEEDIPGDKWDYPGMKKFILENYKRPFDHNTPKGERAFKLMKRFIMALIGTRPLNTGQILIHGHNHSEHKRNFNMINMSAEAWNYGPASEEEMILEIKKIREEMDLSQKTKEDLEDSKYDYYKELSRLVRDPHPRLKEFRDLCNLIYTDQPRHLRVPKNYSQAWLDKAYSLNLFIPMGKLEDGKFYKGHCRNASVAKWNSKTETFTYIREKFGARFSEEINTVERDNGYDLFVPEKEYNPTEEELKEFDSLV